MRVVEAKAFGGPEVLGVTEAVDPVAGPDEVLVEVAAADVMYLDTQLRRGWGQDFFPITPPYVPGGAVAGEIVAIGADVDASWLGRRVATRTAASGIGRGLPTGGYAELALAKAEALVQVAAGLDMQQAVALVHDGRTAPAVAEVADFRPGEWVLITAAAGGLGVLLIQSARAAGAHVIAAARGTRKLELVEKLGADVALDYATPGWSEGATAATGGAGVAVVLDGAGGRLGADAFDAAAPGARFIGYGAASGDFVQPDPRQASERGITVHSLSDVTRAVTDWNRLAEKTQADVAAGRLELVIGQTFPLDQAAEAHAAIEARAAVGRTLLLLR